MSDYNPESPGIRLLVPNERSDLIESFGGQGSRVLEIGVSSAAFSKMILQSGAQLVGVDPFEDTEGVIEGFYDQSPNLDAALALEQEYLDTFSLVRETSTEALVEYSDGSFDWIFVDGDHTHHGARHDIEASSRLVRSGGVILCHDFARHALAQQNKQEVVEAVTDSLDADASIALYGIALSVYPSAVLLKDPDERRIAELDDELKPWISKIIPRHYDPDTFSFKQVLTKQNELYVVRHEVIADGVPAIIETKSTRIFSGYYHNREYRLLTNEMLRKVGVLQADEEIEFLTTSTSDVEDREVEEIHKQLEEKLTLVLATVDQNPQKGVGLAAPQIGISKRAFAYLAPGASGPIYMFNPRVIQESDETHDGYEGCLSSYKRRYVLTRPNEITVEYTDENGVLMEGTFRGGAARMVSHELDHLDGLIVNRSPDHIDESKYQKLGPDERDWPEATCLAKESQQSNPKGVEHK